MLKIEKLKKVYEDGTVGVDGLDLEVKAGEIFVMLGANGAGKTSTIMMIFGFTEPTEGKILINDIDVNKDPLSAKQHAAYVSENVTLYGNFTARQNLEFFTSIGGKKKRDDALFKETIAKVGLAEDALYRRVKGFSKGMRQRLGIAIAMLKEAGLIVLDEPSSGLDAKGAAEFLEIVKTLRSEGRAILMSSHDIFRAKAIADRVGIMRRGQLIEVIESKDFDNVDLEKLYIDYMQEEVAGSTSAAQV